MKNVKKFEHFLESLKRNNNNKQLNILESIKQGFQVIVENDAEKQHFDNISRGKEDTEFYDTVLSKERDDYDDAHALEREGAEVYEERDAIQNQISNSVQSGIQKASYEQLMKALGNSTNDSRSHANLEEYANTPQNQRQDVIHDLREEVQGAMEKLLEMETRYYTIYQDLSSEYFPLPNIGEIIKLIDQFNNTSQEMEYLEMSPQERENHHDIDPFTGESRKEMEAERKSYEDKKAKEEADIQEKMKTDPQFAKEETARREKTKSDKEASDKRHAEQQKRREEKRRVEQAHQAKRDKDPEFAKREDDKRQKYEDNYKNWAEKVQQADQSKKQQEYRKWHDNNNKRSKEDIQADDKRKQQKRMNKIRLTGK